VAKIPPGVGPKYPHVITLFGATGDLSRRKLLPGLFRLASLGFIPGCRIIGVSLEDMTADAFRGFGHEALREFSTHKSTEEAWSAFAANLDYVPISGGAAALKAAVARAETSFDGAEVRRLHYLSVPPAAALPAVRTLGEAALIDRARIVMEKPFGLDLDSAVSLNARLHEVFAEEQIFRIDHFLGKEPAQNILAFRFANGLFEPIWNRNFIDHVQIDVPETLDLGKRIAFYEKTGAYRDMVVTHLFQILAFMAMEPPAALEPAAISEEKNKVFRSLLPIKPTEVVRGQYIGYRDEEGVDRESDTETFIALKCAIDNWRWAGVPFYLRSGKRLAKHVTEIVIEFRRPPLLAFGKIQIGTLEPNRLVLQIQPEEGIKMEIKAKRPGATMQLTSVALDFSYSDFGPTDKATGYERLLYDAMIGDTTLFHRADMVEAAWRIATPILDVWGSIPPRDFPNYAAMSWGPASADDLIHRDGRHWRNP